MSHVQTERIIEATGIGLLLIAIGAIILYAVILRFSDGEPDNFGWTALLCLSLIGSLAFFVAGGIFFYWILSDKLYLGSPVKNSDAFLYPEQSEENTEQPLTPVEQPLQSAEPGPIRKVPVYTPGQPPPPSMPPPPRYSPGQPPPPSMPPPPPRKPEISSPPTSDYISSSSKEAPDAWKLTLERRAESRRRGLDSFF